MDRRIPMSRVVLPLMIVAAPLVFSSCAALYFLGGKGSQPALYTIPKGKRVLVFVDAPASVTLPPDCAKLLGEKISDHLYKYKATDTLVAQARLTSLRNDPTFAKMGIADVAREADADIVIYVNIVAFNLASSTDSSVTQADAQVLVKTVDRDGKRLYPTADAAGAPAEAHLDPTLVEGRTQAMLVDEVNARLAVHVGRMFHKYDLEDAEMTK